MLKFFLYKNDFNIFKYTFIVSLISHQGILRGIEWLYFSAKANCIFYNDSGLHSIFWSICSMIEIEVVINRLREEQFYSLNLDLGRRLFLSLHF